MARSTRLSRHWPKFTDSKTPTAAEGEVEANTEKQKGLLDGQYEVSIEEPGYCWAIAPRWGYHGREPSLPGGSGSVVLLGQETKHTSNREAPSNPRSAP
jgi:hypothetical protein